MTTATALLTWTEEPHNGRKAYRAGRFHIRPHGAKRFVLVDPTLPPEGELLTPKPTTLAECKAIAEESARYDEELATQPLPACEQPIDDLNGDPEPWLTAEREQRAGTPHTTTTAMAQAPPVLRTEEPRRQQTETQVRYLLFMGKGMRGRIRV